MTARQYHDGTKHHFNRFAPSLGYLDWASQPNPFRSFGVPAIPLSRPSTLRQAQGRPELGRGTTSSGRGEPVEPRGPGGLPGVPDVSQSNVTYDRLFQPALSALPVSASAIGDVLRHALGLSAWKRFRESRWALRVNPSSGNLHPTEAYVVAGPLAGLTDTPAVYHYAPDRHALEVRCGFDADAWQTASGDSPAVWLVALTSIHWREAWKYGERAFRYCQHDLGHAVAAVRLAAALAGWRATILPQWSQRTVAAVTGIDRDEDFANAEREEPACVMAVTSGEPPTSLCDGRALAAAIQRGQWSGTATQLSEDHVEWTFIDKVARATEDSGHRDGLKTVPYTDLVGDALQGVPILEDVPTFQVVLRPPATDRGLDARALILQRRSALAFDGTSATTADAFTAMLSRVMPGSHPPWDALWWTARVHFVLFVHRVEGVERGVYWLARDPEALPRIKAACGREFLWEQVAGQLPLYLLARGDCRSLARRVSCDQDIAADGFFSLGMIAEFDASLNEYGESFYRHLFWESGFVGQILYLEAEAAGARATGIGCFYDDPVHDVLGLDGHAFQSLYHFTVGAPVEDARLTTEAAYL